MVYLEAADYTTRLDCIEEKTTGVRKIISESGRPVYNHVLVWLSNQLDMNPENSILFHVQCQFEHTYLQHQEQDREAIYVDVSKSEMMSYQEV